MADYYVDPTNGNDTTGTGSSGTPWATLQKAIDNANGGDTIHLANTSADTLSAAISWTSFGSTTGASNSAPLRICGWDNGGSLVIPHPSGDITCGKVDINSIAAPLNSGSEPSPIHWKAIDFANCTATGTHYVIRNDGSGTTYTQCRFTGTGGQASSPKCMLYCSGNGQSVTNCMIDIVSPVGSPAGILFTAGSGNRAIGNYIRGAVAASISCSGKYHLIQNNILEVSGSSGIDPGTGDFQQIVGNTFVGDGSASQKGIDFSDASAASHIVLNNIFKDFNGTSACGISVTGGNGQTIVGNNHFHNCTTNIDGTLIAGLDLTANDQTTDPTFTDAANQDWSVGDNAKAKGWPTGFLGSSDGANTGTQSFVDMGAAQREEPSGGASGGMISRRFMYARDFSDY